MKLYLTPHACSLAVDIVARELGILLALEWVDVRAKKLRDGSDYYKVNPKGQVPTLEMDDGEFLTEGPVIVQFLADGVAGNDLLAAPGSMARYRVLEWMNFVGTELHKGFTPLFRPTTPREYRDIARQNLENRFRWLDGVLAGKPFLTGATFTVADAYCYTILMWSKLHDIDLTRWPSLKAYVERIADRPSVKAAEKAERAAKTGP
ncbi:MAG: glutathione transferase GstA [Proteobacteria bacterium]|nr:glutathione transferase GstA [Pseudomonadota bacterium]